MKAAEERIVGVDVGGSSLKLGVLDAEGEEHGEDTLPVAEGAATGEVLDALAERVRALAGGNPAAIGLGLPGALDREHGRIELSPNLPWLSGVAMRDELVRRLDCPPAAVVLENDANAAAVGEQRRGSGSGLDDMVFLTLGTGVGSGLVLGGRLWIGAGLACEAGHVCIEPDGPVCGCGRRGCLEVFASATAAHRRALAAGLPEQSPGDVELLTDRARAGHGPERELLHAIGRDLGHGLAAVLVLVDVRTFVFGGGFAPSLPVMEPAIRAGIAERSWGTRAIDLRRATLENRAGWIGSAILALDRLHAGTGE